MITNIFPTPVYEEHLEIDNSSLIDSLNAVVDNFGNERLEFLHRFAAFLEILCIHYHL